MAKKYLLEKHKLIYHPDKLDKFMKNEIFAPITVEISPSARCNHKCSYCYTEYVMKSGISPKLIKDELYFKALKDCADFGVKSLSIGGTGEPLMHNQTPKAIAYAKELGLDVGLTTNGVLATKKRMESCLKNLTWVRFSVSGGEAKFYAKNQGAPESDFYQTLTNLKDLVEIKRKNSLDTTIGVAYFLLEGSSGEEIVPYVKALKEIGIDYVQIKPLGDFEKNNYKYKKDTYKILAEQLKESGELSSNGFYCQVKYERFIALEKTETEGFDLPEKCWGLKIFTVIGSDAKVYTCSGSWYEAKDCYGSLEDNTLEEIWNSKRFADVFERRSKTDVKLCFTQCHCIPMNKFLMELKDPPEHVNYV